MNAQIPFDNSYARLPADFYAQVAPAVVDAPQLIKVNRALAAELGIDADMLETPEGVDMLAVLRHYDLPLKFPRKVLQEVRRFGSEVTKADLAGRTDCRDHPEVTIDPADARDFDDAFSLMSAKCFVGVCACHREL